MGSRSDSGLASLEDQSDAQHNCGPREVPQFTDERLIALGNWGNNVLSKKQRWTKPTILFDEPRDFTLWPLEEGELAA
jgi:hypothetical protein